MHTFTLATVRTPEGRKAALGVEGAYYLLDVLRPELRWTVRTLVDHWDTSLPLLQGLVDRLTEKTDGPVAPIEASLVQFETPVVYPNKLMAVGANYSGHLKEMGLAVQKWESMPFLLRPPTTTLVGPGETVHIPRSTKQFDWELELVVIVCKRLRNATREEAATAVAGYSIGLDLSCRDLIPSDNDLKIDLVRGKAQDTMAPCGPYLMPAAFVPDPYNLRLQLSVNGEPMMDTSSSEMLYHIDGGRNPVSVETVARLPGLI
ncbi:MAG: fumarylacetoacetate hydrolase family protein [Isosphaeraceae bacterium]